MSRVAWATLIREHLAGSRRGGLDFSRAWDLATAAHPVPRDTPAEVRSMFLDGYHRHVSSSVGILAEDRGEPVDFPRPAAVAALPRRCGSSQRCTAPVAPDRVRFVVKSKARARVTVIVPEVGPSFLCPDHQAEVLAAVGRAEYRDRAEVAREKLLARQAVAA